MRALRSIAAAIGLFAWPVISLAVPVNYSFDLTVTELTTGGSSGPIDPYYSNFHLGQQFHGTFTYDPDAAVPTFPGSSNYLGVMSYSVMIGDGLILGGPPSEFLPGPRVAWIDSPAGGGSDELFMFDEVPRIEGSFGSDPNGYVEQFFFRMSDSTGSLFASNTPQAVDWSAFDGTLFNFWWQPEDYVRLLMFGTVGNIQTIPEPTMLVLFAIAFALLGARLVIRRRRPGADGATALPAI